MSASKEASSAVSSAQIAHTDKKLYELLAYLVGSISTGHIERARFFYQHGEYSQSLQSVCQEFIEGSRVPDEYALMSIVELVGDMELSGDEGDGWFAIEIGNLQRRIGKDGA